MRRLPAAWLMVAKGVGPMRSEADARISAALPRSTMRPPAAPALTTVRPLVTKEQL